MHAMAPHTNATARFDLTGKIAWLTGGAGFFGSVVAHALAEHGAHVVVSDVRGDAAHAVQQEMQERGLSAESAGLDICNEAEIVRFTDGIISKHGHLDVVVSMAYFYTKTAMDQMTSSEWEQGMRVSLTGAFLVGRESARVMRPQRRGSIIQFSSMYGLVSPDPRIYGTHYVNPIDYGVAKAGVLQMVRYQAVMLASSNVRCNAVTPGPFPHQTGQGADKEFVKRLEGKVPLGRVGRAEEITGPVVFLASDASSYVTGTQIVVDGGWTAW